MSETSHLACAEQDGGTTDDDHRMAMRFVLGRPGWRVEAREVAGGETYLSITTPCSKTGRQRHWRLARTQQGLLIHDEASGQHFAALPTMREALVQIWEAATGDVPD